MWVPRTYHKPDPEPHNELHNLPTRLADRIAYLALDLVELQAELVALKGELVLGRVAVLVDHALGDEAGHPIPCGVVRPRVGPEAPQRTKEEEKKKKKSPRGTRAWISTGSARDAIAPRGT